MPTRRSKQPIYVGCATDAKFVEPTAVMLTSLAVNGCVPEATILVAAFDLSESDKASIRIGAGKGRRVQFVEVTEAMLKGVRNGTLENYPPAALGRLVLADIIKEPNARLLTIDSDMIVNVDLRPLFGLDLGDHYFAAVHDPPRLDDLNYFNSGLTLTDVDMYKFWDVGRRSVMYCANNRPRFADQDALNEVVGHHWYRLDPLWNYFKVTGREMTPDDYDAAKVAHFPGWKPWDHWNHPGYRLYWRYHAQYSQLVYDAQNGWVSRFLEKSLKLLGLDKVEGQLDKQLTALMTAIQPQSNSSEPALHRAQMPADGINRSPRDVIASGYEILLGRSLEDGDIVSQRRGWSDEEIIRSIVTSDEFSENALRWVHEGVIPSDLFQGAPTIRQRYWAADHLGLGEGSICAMEQASSWRELLEILLSDEVFCERHNIAVLRVTLNVASQ